MSKKKLIVITEGGQNIGFGHVTRTISLATNFLSLGYNVEFIINGDNSLNELVESYNNQIFNWLEDKQKLLDSLKDSSLILLDSILIEDSHIKQLESLEIPIIFIDDERQRNILEKGFVVDWTVFRDNDLTFIDKKENVTYLLGSLFTPLRKEFCNAELNQINQNVSKIMVTFGGLDIRNLTPMILKLLNKNFPNFKKDIIIGAGFSNIEEIKKNITENTNLIYNATAQDMINAMQTSDIAIASGGQTLYELAKIGLPTIGILLVDNAKDDTFGWNKAGFLRYVGSFNEIGLEKNIIKEIENLFSYDTRVEMQKNGLKHISQNGGELLVNEIIKVLNDNI